MAKAYWVATYRSISDPDKLAAYAKLAGPAIQAAGGKFLARGTPVKTYEAGLNQRCVVIEFPSVAAATGAHDSPAYKALSDKHSFTGEVTAFGKKYDANYAPLTSDDGKLTGALFVGIRK